MTKYELYKTARVVGKPDDYVVGLERFNQKIWGYLCVLPDGTKKIMFVSELRDFVL